MTIILASAAVVDVLRSKELYKGLRVTKSIVHLFSEAIPSAVASRFVFALT